MAYTYRYINKLEQFNYVSYTLILEDEDGVMPIIRNDKCFSKAKIPVLTQSHLDNEANNDITIHTENYQDEITLNQMLEDARIEEQEQNESLLSNLEDAIESNDPQKILDQVYSLLKNNDSELSSHVKTAIDKLENGKVVDPKLVEDLATAQEAAIAMDKK